MLWTWDFDMEMVQTRSACLSVAKVKAIKMGCVPAYHDLTCFAITLDIQRLVSFLVFWVFPFRFLVSLFSCLLGLSIIRYLVFPLG